MSKLKLWRICFAMFVICLAAAVASPAQTLTTLIDFDGRNGYVPFAPLVQGLDGKFYGTTAEGGMNSSICDGVGCGTLFSITTQGTLTTLHTFCSEPSCADGYSPQAGLLVTNSGALYGTTAESGSAYLTGTVFVLAPNGKLSTLQNFLSVMAAFPSALIQTTATDFYGTAGYYGTPSGAGAVYRIAADGALTTVFQFDGSDGGHPLAPLLEASDRNFYGTTSGECGGCGKGTVFKVSPSGTLTTLHAFDGSDGYNPVAGLALGLDGNFYGTTLQGGTSSACTDGCGTVFRITPSGMLTSLHSFDGTDGANPYGALVLGTDGNFYGTTADYLEVGGGSGTIFKITPDGTFTNLHTFTGTDGQFPSAGLIQGTDGNFYGTTAMGGKGYGTVFQWSMGLGPFIRTLESGGVAGSEVAILGNNLTGATSVTFNGTPAQFSVRLPTLIFTHVPKGATTGPVQVTVDGQMLWSNFPFYVQP